ncbi:hypothetical protein HanIR_Chr10g0502641 [Helianthus annuus]|nr:hypothetical protein HanIR_Chr10g0502641 [Helianthus annuus]
MHFEIMKNPKQRSYFTHRSHLGGNRCESIHDKIKRARTSSLEVKDNYLCECQRNVTKDKMGLLERRICISSLRIPQTVILKNTIDW